MAMPDFSRYRVRILCEDKEHNSFVRAFFKSLGVGERKFDTCPLVDGKRSAEGHVRGLLPDALAEIRKTSENIFLVAVSDADKNNPNLADREKQWNEALRFGGFPEICEADRILRVIPKRNIETWFAWLDGEEAIDEAKDYKQGYKGAKAAQYGKRFYKKYKNYKEKQETACDNAPPSIRGACFEFDRFCRALDEHERQRESSTRNA